jgi:hypothetical protein
VQQREIAVEKVVVNTSHSLSLFILLASLSLATGCGGPSGIAAGDTEGDSEATTEGDTDAGSGTSGGPAGDDMDPGPDPDPDPGPGPGPGPSPGTGDTGTGDEPTPDACAALEQCLPPLPDDWQGPVVVRDQPEGDATVECGGAFPVQVPLALGRDLQEGAAVCDCSCSPVDAECTLHADLSYWDIPSGLSTLCFSSPPDGSFSVQDGITLSFPTPYWVDDPLAAWRLDGSTQTLAGSCNPTVSAMISPPAFATDVLVCGLAEEPDACEGEGICSPVPAAPYDGGTCIWREGDYGCTDPSYPNRSIAYLGYTDDRACAECSCGPLTGDCTDEHYTPGYYNDFTAAFVWENEQIPLNGTCENMSMPAGSVYNAISAVPGDPVGQGCEAAPGSDVVIGEAQPAEPVTFCCTG